MIEPGDDRSVSVNAPLVVSETIDGEAIIMHHGSGLYFDTTGSGAVLWQAIERTTNIAALTTLLRESYGLERQPARAAVERWLGELATHDLIVRSDAPVAALQPLPSAGAFADPVLGVHADLADMLLLDPIHDVDSAGWPSARPQV